MNAPVRLNPRDLPGFALGPKPRWSDDEIILALDRLGYASDPVDGYAIIRAADRGQYPASWQVEDAEEWLEAREAEEIGEECEA